jgi:prepilin-type processing-associated H-X9-DG protein
MPNNGRNLKNRIRNDWSKVPNENLGFGSSHTGGANMLKVDGAVEFLSEKTDSKVLEQLGHLKLNNEK